MKKAILPFLFLVLLFALPLFGCQKECRHEAMTETVVPPDCERSGYTLHRCPDCSVQYSSDFVPPRGHQMTATVHAPTCEEEGYTHSVCDCGYETFTDYIAPTGHGLAERVLAPTCTEAGYTLQTCSRCSYTNRKDVTPATGHSWVDQVVEPTCLDQGYTLQTCSVCAHSQRIRYTLALGHRHTPVVSSYPTPQGEGAVTHTCACGDHYQTRLPYSHVFPGGAVTESEGVLAKGVDVSKWQHTVTEDGSLAPLCWETIRRAGFDFAILKAGSTPRDGTGGMDPVFEMNYRDARAAGMELGVYFYTYATTEEGLLADAALLISWLRDKQLEYPVYLDLEDPSLAVLGKETLTEFCHLFLSALQEAGLYGALYSNNNWLTEYLDREELYALYDIWYARYPTTSTDAVSPSAEHFWDSAVYGAHLGLWQYTQFGTIEGFENVYFDFNYAYRDYPALIKQFGYNGFPLGTI